MPNCIGKGISVFRGSNVSVYNNNIINSDIGINVSHEESKNARIYNNTIVGALHGIIIQDNAPLVRIKNNLIANSIETGINANWGVYKAVTPDEDYNLVYNSGRRDYVGLEQGRNSITEQDPNLAEDYRLSKDSPAIDAGISVGITYDIEGKKVPNGGIPDIGAFEYYDDVGGIPIPPKNVQFFRLN
jgi:hypothetical protein